MNLTVIRRSHDLSIPDLAEILRVHVETIEDIESGRTENPEAARHIHLRLPALLQKERPAATGPFKEAV